MNRNRFWSPYVAGVLLGLTLLATFVVMGRGLGASGAYSLLTGVGLHSLTPRYADSLTYFHRYLDSPTPLMDWNLFLLGGVFLGALTGSLLSRNFAFKFDRGESMSVGKRFLTAFTGGAFMGFAARLARGCTSGIALTGGAQLALSGWVFVIAMFATGFLFAAVFRRLWS